MKQSELSCPYRGVATVGECQFTFIACTQRRLHDGPHTDGIDRASYPNVSVEWRGPTYQTCPHCGVVFEVPDGDRVLDASAHARKVYLSRSPGYVKGMTVA